MNRFARLAIFALGLLAASSAAAEDVKFCFFVYGDYTDAGDDLRNGLSEDYWTTAPTARGYRGGKYQIRLGSSTGTLVAGGSLDPYLGDGLGTGDPGIACSTVISLSNVNQTFWYRLDSEVYVNGNTIVGRRDDTGGTCYRSTTHTNSEGPGTHYVTMSGSSEDCKDVFRAVGAAAFSLYRHNGGNSGETFNLRTRGTCSGCNGNCNYTIGQTFCLSDAGANRKFTISHEMGHALIRARSSTFGGDCSFNDNAKCPTGTGWGDHAMASQEWSSCALKEAFAHFYAADTYNNHNQDDCAFNYMKPYFPPDPDLGEVVFDCEVASSDKSALETGTTPTWSLHPLRTMETINPPNFSTAGCSTPWVNKSTEGDWLRVLWNMHTDGSSPPSFTAIVDWLVGAGISTQSCYTQLNNEAISIGGTLKTNWDSNKARHGVDN